MNSTNSKYFVYCEEDKDMDKFLKIPTRLLFHLYENKYIVVMINDRGCRDVEPHNYSYSTDEEYKWSCFKYDKDYHPLSEFQKKLLKTCHYSWYNTLKPVFDSSEFLILLKHIAELRKTKELTPNKEEVSKFLLNPIEDTVIPESLINEKEVGKGFLNYCNKIKEQRVLTKKKFDY